MASDDCDCSSCIDDRHESSQIREDDPTDEAPTPVSSPVASPPQALLQPLGVYELESGLRLKIKMLDDGKIETLFTLNGEEVKKDCSDTLPKKDDIILTIKEILHVIRVYSWNYPTPPRWGEVYKTSK